MPLQLIAGPIIMAGESLSAAVDCSAGKILRLTMPQVWTDANLSFQGSSDGIAFSDVFSIGGREAVIPVVAGTTVILAAGSGPDQMPATSPPDVRGFTWLKVRSGTRRYPVIQGEDRAFSITLET